MKSFTLKILIFDHSLELDDSFNLADAILERDEKILFEPVECISSVPLSGFVESTTGAVTNEDRIWKDFETCNIKHPDLARSLHD